MVTDVNDNPPQFTHYIFKGDVSEAATPGHVILQVSLTTRWCVFSSKSFIFLCKTYFHLLPIPLGQVYIQ